MKKRSKRQAGFPPRHNIYPKRHFKTISNNKIQKILHTTIFAKAFVCYKTFDYLSICIPWLFVCLVYLTICNLYVLTKWQMYSCPLVPRLLSVQQDKYKHEGTNTKTQRHNDIKTLRYKDTKTQRHKHKDTNTKTQWPPAPRPLSVQQDRTTQHHPRQYNRTWAQCKYYSAKCCQNHDE